MHMQEKMQPTAW